MIIFLVEIMLYTFILGSTYVFYKVIMEESGFQDKEISKEYFYYVYQNLAPLFIVLCNGAVYGLMQEPVYLYILIFWVVTSIIYYVIKAIKK